MNTILELLSPLAPWARFVHILCAMLLVTGLIGRWVALSSAERAARGSSLESVRALLGASTIFERMVVSSSLAVLVLGLTAAWSIGYPLLGFLQGAHSNWLLV